jgi:hypothetical protein
MLVRQEGKFCTGHVTLDMQFVTLMEYAPLIVVLGLGGIYILIC